MTETNYKITGLHVTETKEKIFGFILIVLFIAGFTFMQNHYETELKTFHICLPTKTATPPLPILTHYKYLDFKKNYPSFFNDYTCVTKQYTKNQVTLLNRK
jgi:hypothetical protein